MQKRKLATAVILLFLLSCSFPVNPPDPREPVFEATVGPPVNVTLSGRAVFGSFVDPSSKQSGFLLQLVTPGDQGISFTRRSANVPAIGAYPVVEFRESKVLTDLRENEFFGLYVHGREVDYSSLFYSDSGGITISEISGDFLIGQFDFKASGYEIREGGSRSRIVVSISGSFDAKKGEVNLK